MMRMNVKKTNCHEQRYDGAANMSCARKGLAAMFTQKESRALYTHCYGHALNLAIADTVKHFSACRNALDTAFQMTRLITFSLKRNAAFDKAAKMMGLPVLPELVLSTTHSGQLQGMPLKVLWSTTTPLAHCLTNCQYFVQDESI